MKSKINIPSILGGVAIAAILWTGPAQSADIEVFVNQLCSSMGDPVAAEDSGGTTPCVFVIDQRGINKSFYEPNPSIDDAAQHCGAVGNPESLLGNSYKDGDTGGADRNIDYGDGVTGHAPMPWSESCYASSNNVSCSESEKVDGECAYWIEGGQDQAWGFYLLPEYKSSDPYVYFDDTSEHGGQWDYIDWFRNLILGTINDNISSSYDKWQKKIIGVEPLKYGDIAEFAGYKQCMAMVIADNSVSMNYDPQQGDIDGEVNGHLWFKIVDYAGDNDEFEMRIVVNPVPEGGAAGWVDDLETNWTASISGDPPVLAAPGALRLLEVPALVSSPAVSVNLDNRLFHDENVYISMFRPDQTLGWIGNLKKYKFCQDTSTGCSLGELLDVNDASAIGTDNKFKDTSKSYWSNVVDGPTVNKGGAGEQVPVHTGRTMYTYTGSDDSPTNPATLTSYDPNGSGVTTEHLDFPIEVADPVAKRVKVMNFMLGKDEKDEDNDNVINEERPWKFPSPLHSRPKILVIPNPNGEDWVKILVGSHHGMLHLINASTGAEEWSFATPYFLRDHDNIYNIAGGDEDSLWGEGIAHVYGLDGNPQVLAEDTSSPADGIPDKWTVVIGCRRGCDRLYALELTADSSGNLTPKFKWRIISGTTTGFSNLGETWSDPLPIAILRNVSSTLTPTVALVMGAGYDVAQDSMYTATDKANGLYLVNPVDGSKLLSIGNKGSTADVELAGMHFPVPGSITTVDSDGTGYIDRLYFADLGGQIWRVDLNKDLTSSTGGVLARLSDYTGDDNSDNPLMAGTLAAERRMYYPPEVTPIYDKEGVSKIANYDVITITSGYRAHPLDKVIKDRIYSIRDYKTTGAITVDGTSRKATNYPLCGGGESLTPCSGPITEANLFDTTSNIIQVGTSAEKAAAAAALKAKEGWYIVLENPASGEDPELLGEKGLAKSTVIDGKLIVTTYVPPQTCDAWTEQGYSRLYAIQLLTGEAIFPTFDGETGLATTDRFMSVGKGLPSKAVPVFQDGGVTLVVSTGGGSGTEDPGVAIPVATTFWFKR